MLEQQVSCQQLFLQEQQYINYFFENLNYDHAQAIFELLLECKGSIFFTGVGKSGIVAKKVATTMVSTGTRAAFLSATDAVHGDLGAVSDDDIVVMFSRSGETDELLNLVPFLRNKGAQVAAVVSDIDSRLAKASSLAVELPLKKELCPFNLAPTTSAAIQMVFGDVLAVALMESHAFSLEEYAKNHPCGNIGRRITMKVADLMLQGPAVPLCSPDALLKDTLEDFTSKRCGCLLVVDEKKHLLGIFTDGDLRRALQDRGASVMTESMEKLMTPAPKAIRENMAAFDAMKLMEADQKRPIMVLAVQNDEDAVVGLIKMHDILQSGL